MKFCVRCGSQILPMSKLCGECGAEARAPSDPSSVSDVRLEASVPLQMLTPASDGSAAVFAAPGSWFEAPAASSADASVRLWNPNVLAGLSLLLTPVFGAWLTARNWSALGDVQRAAGSLRWAYGLAALIFVLVLFVSSDGLCRLLITGAYVVWIWRENIPQMKHVKQHLGDNYVRMPWGRVVAIGTALTLGSLFVVGLIAIAFAH